MASYSHQQITPELRQWIVQQAQAGQTATQVLASMRESGWDEDVAVDALETTLRDHLDDDAMSKGWPAAVKVPEPAMKHGSLKLDAGDRMVDVLVNMIAPRVIVFGNLLSDEECDALIESARPRVSRSMTVDTQNGGEELNEARTSSGMFFQRGETDLIQRIEARIAKLLDWPEVNGEGLQILHYTPGTEYQPHYDYFDPAQPGTPTLLARGGQRVATLIIYLQEPVAGGGTVFPDARFEVAPKRGNAVFFNYERPHPATRTLHGGAPVIEGEKWIATKWLREREFK